jgi:Rod binding domain-containing protein
MADPVSSVALPSVSGGTGAARDVSRMRETAIQLEASFLAEMLQHAGLGETSEAFGGGVGEEQFASFLRQEQANLMARKGGIGLAEVIFNAMSKEAQND